MKKIVSKKIYPLIMLGILLVLHGAYFGLNLRYRYTYTDVLAKFENAVLYIALIVIGLLVIYVRYSMLLCVCAKYGRKGSAVEFGVAIFSLLLSSGQEMLGYYFDDSAFFATYLKYYLGSVLLSLGITLVVMLFLWVWVSEIWRKNKRKKVAKVPYFKIFLVTAIVQYIMQFSYQAYILIDTIIAGEFESGMVLNAIHKFAYPLFTCAVGFVIMMLVAKLVNKKVLRQN